VISLLLVHTVDFSGFIAFSAKLTEGRLGEFEESGSPRLARMAILEGVCGPSTREPRVSNGMAARAGLVELIQRGPVAA